LRTAAKTRPHWNWSVGCDGSDDFWSSEVVKNGRGPAEYYQNYQYRKAIFSSFFLHQT
jgi:hypothetical protein